VLSKAGTVASKQSTGVQLSLLGTPEAPRNGARKASFEDPAFANNKKLPLHRWVPWIAGFSADFVRGALQRHLRKKGVVLDPFTGVGTTLVEATLAGHSAFGFEINPYAAFASRTKLDAFRINLNLLLTTISLFRDFYRGKISQMYCPQSTPPPGFKTRGEFYSSMVLRKVLILQDFIASIEDNTIQDLFRLAFASTMVTYSNYSYEPSLGQRKSAGRENIEDYPVSETIVSKLYEMVEDIKLVQSQLAGEVPKWQVFNESFFDCQGKFPPGTVDLLLTSPPYLNNYHYNRNTRPHLYWLAYAKCPEDMKSLEEANFGKFWQTVRERDRVELEFKLNRSTLQEQLQELRKLHPEKGVYGGNGWANYAAAYFNDCYRFAKCAKYVLKRGGTALVVIGNSILQGTMIPTDQYLGQIAESVGLRLVEIHVPRATRVGNSIIQSEVRVKRTHKSHQLYEAVVELRKR